MRAIGVFRLNCSEVCWQWQLAVIGCWIVMSVMSVDTSIANLIGLESGRYPVSRCKHEVGVKSFMKTIGKQILNTNKEIQVYTYRNWLNGLQYSSSPHALTVTPATDRKHNEELTHTHTMGKKQPMCLMNGEFEVWSPAMTRNSLENSHTQNNSTTIPQLILLV